MYEFLLFNFKVGHYIERETRKKNYFQVVATLSNHSTVRLRASPSNFRDSLLYEDFENPSFCQALALLNVNKCFSHWMTKPTLNA